MNLATFPRRIQEILASIEEKGEKREEKIKEIIKETEVPDGYPFLGILLGNISKESQAETLHNLDQFFGSSGFFSKLQWEVQDISSKHCYYSQMGLIRDLFIKESRNNSAEKSELLRIFLAVIAGSIEETGV